MHDPSFARRPGSKEAHEEHIRADLEPLGVVHTTLNNPVVNSLAGGPMTVVSPNSWGGVTFHLRTSWDSATSSMAYENTLGRRVHTNPQRASEKAAGVFSRLQAANDGVFAGIKRRGDKMMTTAHWAMIGGVVAYLLLLLIAYDAAPPGKDELVFPAGIFALVIGSFFALALMSKGEKVVHVPMLDKKPRNRISWGQLTPKQWTQAREQVFEAMFETDEERDEFIAELKEAARTAGITAHGSFKASHLAHPVKKFLGGEVHNGDRPERVPLVEFVGTLDGHGDNLWCMWDGKHFFYYYQRPRQSQVEFSIGGTRTNRTRRRKISKAECIHLA